MWASIQAALLRAGLTIGTILAGVIVINVLIVIAGFAIVTSILGWQMGCFVAFLLGVMALSNLNVPLLLGPKAWRWALALVLLIGGVQWLTGGDIFGSIRKSIRTSSYSSSVGSDASSDKDKIFVIAKGVPLYRISWGSATSIRTTDQNETEVVGLGEKEEVNGQTLVKVALPDKHGRGIESEEVWVLATDLTPKAEKAKEKEKEELARIAEENRLFLEEKAKREDELKQKAEEDRKKQEEERKKQEAEERKAKTYYLRDLQPVVEDDGTAHVYMLEGIPAGKYEVTFLNGVVLSSAEGCINFNGRDHECPGVMNIPKGKKFVVDDPGKLVLYVVKTGTKPKDVSLEFVKLN